MAFFQIDSLSIAFGGLRALDAISLQIEKGEILAVIGPNGAGKTTLFNCINGLYRPMSGSYQVSRQRYYRVKTGSNRSHGDCAHVSEH